MQDRILYVQMTEQEYQEYKQLKDLNIELVKALEAEKKKEISRIIEDPKFKELYQWWQNSLDESSRLRKELSQLKKENKKNWFVRFLIWLKR